MEKILTFCKQWIPWIIENLKLVYQAIGISDELIPEVIGATIIGAFLTSISGLWKGGKRLILWNKQRRLNRDLSPYYTSQDVDNATRFYIPTKYQNVAPSIDDEPGRSFIASAKEKLIPLFLKKAFRNKGKDIDNKYYLVLADSGMGKTTFMINLYIAYKRQWAWQRKYNIKLLPLGHPHTFEDIKSMADAEKEKTILLLDAFDEDPLAVADYKKRLNDILKEVWRFREIVITCRTQFFSEEEEEPSKTGYYRYGGEGGEFNFQKIYVAVFDNKAVRQYLLKRFNLLNPFKWKRLKHAWEVTKKSPNLMVRPMLLSNINDLLDSSQRFDYAYQIYETLIEKWVDRESKKAGIREKYGSLDNFKEQLIIFSRSLAIHLYQRSKLENKNFSIHKDELIPTSGNMQLVNYEIDLESIKDSDWRSRSLLNRDAAGNYKFSHKSVMEYFLVLEAVNSFEFARDLDFSGLNAAQLFYKEKAWKILAKDAKGGFKTTKNNKELDISLLSKKRYQKDIFCIRITNVNTINIAILKHLPVKVLILTDKENFSILYNYYLVLFIDFLMSFRPFLSFKEKIAELNKPEEQEIKKAKINLELAELEYLKIILEELEEELKLRFAEYLQTLLRQDNWLDWKARLELLNIDSLEWMFLKKRLNFLDKIYHYYMTTNAHRSFLVSLRWHNKDIQIDSDLFNPLTWLKFEDYLMQKSPNGEVLFNYEDALVVKQRYALLEVLDLKELLGWEFPQSTQEFKKREKYHKLIEKKDKISIEDAYSFLDEPVRRNLLYKVDNKFKKSIQELQYDDEDSIQKEKFNSINEFIKQSQELEELMVNTNIYY